MTTATRPPLAPALAARKLVRRPAAPAADANADPVVWRLTLMGLLTFACGALGFVRINLVGDVYVGELALIGVGLIAAVTGGIRGLRGNTAFLVLVGCALLTIVGYILSDLIRATPQAQYIRGWARNAIVLTSFVSLALLFAADRRNFWWYVAGLGIGGVLYLKGVMNYPFNSVTHWKFAYSIPFTFLVAATVIFLPLRLVALLFVALGCYSMFEDYRIHGAICVVIGALLWSSAIGRRPKVTPGLLLKMGLMGAIGIGIAFTVLSMSRGEYETQRRESSNSAREQGLKFGVAAIINSPIIGYGSWSVDPELIQVAVESQYGENASGPRGPLILNPHSQVLAAWIEGGILGAALFLALGFYLARESWYAVLNRPGDLLTPAILFAVMFQGWHLVASPLGTDLRLFVATALATVVMLYGERTRPGQMKGGASRRSAGRLPGGRPMPGVRPRSGPVARA
jgi:hypothetical protein